MANRRTASHAIQAEKYSAICVVGGMVRLAVNRAFLALVVSSWGVGCSLPHAALRSDAAQDIVRDVPDDRPDTGLDIGDVPPPDVADVIADGDDGDAGPLDVADVRDAEPTDAQDAADVRDVQDVADVQPPIDVPSDVQLCSSGQMLCGGSCVDTQTSLDHCGACGRACSATQVCRAGTCSAPVDCAELRMVRPTAASGTVAIDHDSNPGSRTVDVFCDMVTDSRGWTVVISAETSFSNRRDLVDRWALLRPVVMASSRMIWTYRDSAGTIVTPGERATFDIPMQLRSENPFDTSDRDIANVSVAIGATAPAMRTIRYGYASFVSDCGSNWNTGADSGRLCIPGTPAPFYNAWNAGGATDYCAVSNGPYSGSVCSTTRQFSIAVTR